RMFGTCAATGTTVSFAAGSSANVAETVAVPDTVQVPAPEQGPFQPRNELPAAAVAANATAVPSGNAVAQVPGQSIPAGVEVTRPAPPPVRDTSRFQEDGGEPPSGAALGPAMPHAAPQNPAVAIVHRNARRQEMAVPPAKTVHGAAFGHVPAGRLPRACGRRAAVNCSEANAPTRPRPVRSALPAISGARRDAPGSRDMAAGVHVALSRERQPGAERLREPVLKPPSDARRAFAGAGDIFTGFDPKAGGEVPHAMLHLGPDLVLQRSDGQTGAAAERGQPEVADLRRILVVEIPVSEQRHVGIAVQRGRRPGREPFVIERRRHGVEGREQVLAAVADPRMRVAVRDGLLAELLSGQRRSRVRADVRDALLDAVMGEGDPAVERPFQVGLAG